MSQQQASPVPPPSAAPCTRAMTGTGQLSTAENIAAAASASATLRSRRELARRAHPLEVGARAEREPAPGDDDRAQGVVPRERRERLVERRDQLGVEGVAALGAVEPDARDTAVALECEPAHIRKTPKRGSGMGARAAAARPSASTRRVSRGSITPSSHRRAVE